MIKKKFIPIAKDSASAPKCGDCLHFKRLAKFEKPCSELGTKHFAKAPECYAPDAYALSPMSPDVLFQMGLMLREMDAKQARVFSALIRQIPYMEKHYGLRLGQPVFFKIGADYLSNYFRGHVLAVTEVGNSQVFVTSDMKKTQRSNPMIASLMRESLLSLTEFKKKRERLVREGRENDPKPLWSKPKKAVDETYVPPSMETAPKEWYDKVAKDKPKAKFKREADGSLTFQLKLGKKKK
jgi:hypothetical protein